VSLTRKLIIGIIISSRSQQFSARSPLAICQSATEIMYKLGRFFLPLLAGENHDQE